MLLLFAHIKFIEVCGDYNLSRIHNQKKPILYVGLISDKD